MGVFASINMIKLGEHRIKPLVKIVIMTVLISLGGSLGGCTIHKTIKSTDIIPQLQTGSPLKSISPKVFLFKEFKDIRGNDPFFVMKIDFNETKLDQTASSVIIRAIAGEFERNGHKCIMGKQPSKSDFIIEGTVYKFGLLIGSGVSGVKMTGNVALKLTISSASGEVRVLTKNYEGEYYFSSAMGVPYWKWKDILKQATHDMIKEISTDSELLEFLEKT
jgi:hypothetical protein